MEDAAAFLAAEGQLELAQALREICFKHRAAEASGMVSGYAHRTRHLTGLETREPSIRIGAG
jgi:hypothetical protein